MSFVDSLKKGLFGGEDDYDDQYIDDGPQMVNTNRGLGVCMDDAEEEPVEEQGGQHPRHHPAQGRSGKARAL